MRGNLGKGRANFFRAMIAAWEAELGRESVPRTGTKGTSKEYKNVKD